jgi:hypothetical protein
VLLTGLVVLGLVFWLGLLSEPGVVVPPVAGLVGLALDGRTEFEVFVPSLFPPLTGLTGLAPLPVETFLEPAFPLGATTCLLPFLPFVPLFPTA